MSRCTGHCCRRFALEKNLDELQAQARDNPTPDHVTIAAMVIPIVSSRDGREHLYTCRNLGPNGDCGIYETRPQMCRDFPGTEGCHFWRCESDQSVYRGMSLFQKIRARYRWLRSI